MYPNLKWALLHVYINFTFPFSDVTILYFIYLLLYTQQKNFTNILFKKESNWKIKTSYFYSPILLTMLLLLNTYILTSLILHIKKSLTSIKGLVTEQDPMGSSWDKIPPTMSSTCLLFIK